MSLLTGLACATLGITLVASGDSGSKPSPDGRSAISLSSASLTGFSAWAYAKPTRNGVVEFRITKDFYDTYFQYRWKSDWIVNHFVCTVEIRPTDDAGDGRTVSEVTVEYSDPQSHGHGHWYTAHDVSIGIKLAHAYMKPADCERVGLVFWRK